MNKEELINKIFVWHMNNTPDPMRGINYMSTWHSKGVPHFWFKEYLRDMYDHIKQLENDSSEGAE